VYNCDWGIYQMLERFLLDLKDEIVFNCPPARDLTYSVEGHRYRLTHGDQFRGGDGIIGPLGPICVTPETPVLKADLSYVPAGELQVGDALIGFDDQPEPGQRRKFQESIVTETKSLVLECLEIETSNGLKTIASIGHPWLIRSGDGQGWCTSENLRLGHRILSLGAPTEKENTWEAGYLAGVLDGEGSCTQSKMQFTQQNNACLRTTTAILDQRDISWKCRENGAEARGYEPCYGIRLFEGSVEGKWACHTIGLLGSLRPPRLLEEQSRQIWEGRSTQLAGEVTVVGLRRVGPKLVAGFTTSTSTFVANGMLTHNTRGDMKKRSMAMGLPGDEEEFDTLVLGHFHQLHMLHSRIINGSLKGYDEYALSCSFGWEPAQQALWLTHRDYGPNHYMPVFAQDPKCEVDKSAPPVVQWRSEPGQKTSALETEAWSKG